MAGYIGSKAVSVNTTSATISDDLSVGDDLTVTDDATIGGTLGVTGIATFTDDIIIGDGKTIGSASDVDAMTIASNGQVTFTQTLIGTALDISGDIDVDGTTNLDAVDIDGAVNMATTALVTGVLTTTAATVFNGGFASADASTIIAADGAADNQFSLIIKNEEATDDRSFGLYIQAGSTVTDSPLHLYEHTGSTQLFRVTGTGQALFTDGSASLPSITNIGDTNTGIFFPAADTIAFAEGGNEIFKLDSSGNVGIKKDDTAIDTRLHMDQCPDNKVITFEQSGRKSAIGTSFSSTSTGSRIDFFVSDGNQNGGNNTRMSILSNGGITFNGDTAAANVLDDYEEGEYDAVLTPASGSFVLDLNALSYTKIGRNVYINGRVHVSAANSPSGNTTISLPFASTTVPADNGDYGSMMAHTYNVNLPDDTVQTFWEISPGSSTGLLLAVKDNAAWENINANNIAVGDIIYISGHYVAT